MHRIRGPKDVSFRLLQPDRPPGIHTRYELERPGAIPALLLQLPGVPFDVLNTTLGAGSEEQVGALERLCRIPRMSTLALGWIIDAAVRAMPEGQAFVNVGVWNGFTFLAGLVNNPGKTCIGIDNFSQFYGPREEFLERFERHATPSHAFHDMDYREYFETLHREPIGVYVYDGEHSYENQLRGLEAAEPFFADGCLVLVDDTNWEEPRRGTLDFIAASRHGYERLFDEPTADKSHPTFWNGVMAFRFSKESGHTVFGGAGQLRGQGEPDGGEGHRPHPFASYRGMDRVDGVPTVSLVVDAGRGDVTRLEETVESALAQTWPALELLVASADHPPTLDDRARLVPGSVAAAVEQSRGEFVAFAGAGARLEAEDVHLGLGYPGLVQFFQAPLAVPERETLEATLEAGETIAGAVPPSSLFVIAGEGLRLPRTISSRPTIPLEAPPRDDAEALRLLEELSAKQPSHLVLMWTAFEWLERYPRFAERLEARSRLVIRDERVAIYDLRT